MLDLDHWSDITEFIQRRCLLPQDPRYMGSAIALRRGSKSKNAPPSGCSTIVLTTGKSLHNIFNFTRSTRRKTRRKRQSLKNSVTLRSGWTLSFLLRPYSSTKKPFTKVNQSRIYFLLYWTFEAKERRSGIRTGYMKYWMHSQRRRLALPTWRHRSSGLEPLSECQLQLFARMLS